MKKAIKLQVSKEEPSNTVSVELEEKAEVQLSLLNGFEASLKLLMPDGSEPFWVMVYLGDPEPFVHHVCSRGSANVQIRVEDFSLEEGKLVKLAIEVDLDWSSEF